MISLMEIEGEGYYEEHDEKKPNLYQKRSERLQKDVIRSMKFAKTDMMEKMKKAQIGLMKINTVESRSKIEMERYENTTTICSIPGYKNLACFYFFITMIGYIDSKIRDERERINFNSSFLPIDDSCNERKHYDEIEKSKERIAHYLIDREEVLDDYHSIMSEMTSEKEFIDSILKEAPSYLNFGKLYEDSDMREYQQDLNANFVNSYNVGFITKDYYGENTSYEQRINQFRRLFSELSIHVNTNKAAVDSVKVMKKNKA